MSTTHEPMHAEAACGRCDRRRMRLAAYAERMAFRASKAGQRAAEKARLLRIARDAHWRKQHARPRRERAANRVRMIRRAWRRVTRPMRPAVAAEEPST